MAHNVSKTGQPTPSAHRFRVESEIFVPAITTRQLKAIRRVANPLEVIPAICVSGVKPRPVLVIYGLKNSSCWKARHIEAVNREFPDMVFCHFIPHRARPVDRLPFDFLDSTTAQHKADEQLVDVLKIQIQSCVGEASLLTKCTLKPRPVEHRRDFISGLQRFSSTLSQYSTSPRPACQLAVNAALWCNSITPRCMFRRSELLPAEAARLTGVDHAPSDHFRTCLTVDGVAANQVTFPESAMTWHHHCRVPAEEHVDNFRYSISTLVEMSDMIVMHRLSITDYIHAPQQCSSDNVTSGQGLQILSDGTVEIKGSRVHYVDPAPMIALDPPFARSTGCTTFPKRFVEDRVQCL